MNDVQITTPLMNGFGDVEMFLELVALPIGVSIFTLIFTFKLAHAYGGRVFLLVVLALALILLAIISPPAHGGPNDLMLGLILIFVGIPASACALLGGFFGFLSHDSSLPKKPLLREGHTQVKKGEVHQPEGYVHAVYF